MTGNGAPDTTTEPASPEVMRRWRSGPRWYFVVAAMIADERVEERRLAVLDRLGTWARPSAPGQAHVTLAACGFDGSPADFEPVQLRLQVSGADLFRSAAYLRVTSTPDAVPTLEQARATVGALDLDRADLWVPHVTVGVFTRRLPLAQVRQRLGPLADLPPLTVTALVRPMAVDTRSPQGALVPQTPPLLADAAVAAPCSDSVCEP